MKRPGGQAVFHLSAFSLTTYKISLLLESLAKCAYGIDKNKHILEGIKIKQKFMQLKYTHFWFLCIILLIMAACEREEMNDPNIPVEDVAPLSQPGKNEVGFKANGDQWISRKGGTSVSSKEFVMDTLSNTFYVMAYHDANDSPRRIDFSLTLRWRPFTKLGEPGSLNRPQFENMTIAYDHKVPNNCSAYRKVKSYKVDVIDCNYSSHKIVGNFELEVENECGDKIEITQGFFNGQFKYASN